MSGRLFRGLAVSVLVAAFAAVGIATAQQTAVKLSYPPQLPGGQTVVTFTSPELLKPTTGNLRPGVVVAKAAPTIDLLYFPGQDYAADPWSNWADSTFHEGKFYATIGDHLSPRGTPLVYEYDPQAKTVRVLANVRRFLETGDATQVPGDVVLKGKPVERGPNSHLAAGENYTPGKIHGALRFGADGWLYFATHRGSARTTNDKYGFLGDNIYRTNPATGVTEIVAAHPVAKHCMPASILDPERLIFYAGTAEGADADRKGIQFLAYDLKNRRVLKIEDGGFSRCAIFDPQSGKVFWDGKVYDPATNTISASPNAPEVRAATRASKDGIVYGLSNKGETLWAFNTRTGECRELGPAMAASNTYVTSMVLDPTERYVYYMPGAHGGSPRDGSPIVQYDLKTNTVKVLTFLHPYMSDTYKFIPEGTFGMAINDTGDTLFIAMNGKRDPAVRAWEICAIVAIHIPESERQP